MKIVIDIPDNDYKFIKDLQSLIIGGRGNCKTIQKNVINAIRNGTPYNPSGDLISRTELKKCAIPCQIHNGALTDLCVPLYQVDNAPTVEPERPQVEWIFVSRHCYKCPFCNELSKGKNYCPNCGADMRGGAE